MQICSYKHEEIVFEEKKCPFCKYIEEMDKRLGEALDTVQELKDEIKSINEVLVRER